MSFLQTHRTGLLKNYYTDSFLIQEEIKVEKNFNNK